MASSFRKTHKFRRYTGGHYDSNGEWNPGSWEEMTILASVQPLGINEATLLRPEGASNLNAVKIYSDMPLHTDKQELEDGTSLVEADKLIWRGKLWKVVTCEAWQNDVINHYRMVAWEVGPYADIDEEVSS